MGSRLPGSFWVLEDTSTYYERELERTRGEGGAAPIAMRLYRVRRRTPELVQETTYLPRPGGRAREIKGTLALELLRRAKVRRGIVVAGARVGQSASFLAGLTELRLGSVVALPPSAANEGREYAGLKRTLFERLTHAKWRATALTAPNSAAHYSIAELGRVTYAGVRGLRCIALSTGGITGFRRGLILGVSSLGPDMQPDQIAYLLGWSRWIRFVSRRASKAEVAASRPMSVELVARDGDGTKKLISELSARANLKLAHRHDQKHAALIGSGLFDTDAVLQGRLLRGRSRLNVVELFAGAGGMGLGFLMNQGGNHRYRILFSGEINPIFANTLRINHEFLRHNRWISEDDVPEEIYPTDLRAPSAMDRVQNIVRDFDGVDIVIGGPPCQGFSNANRNSWSSQNPNNKLVDTFLDYVVRLRPRVFIMENVQGILWTPRHSHDQLSVAEHVASRLAAAGYRIFPKLLDAAWYGVPQHRNRFFLLGIHRDLGYGQDDFGEWGPFPRPTHGPMGATPYVTVCEAIGDLPPIGNAATVEELPYRAPDLSGNEFLQEMRRWAPSEVIWDHVTSRHSDYVIERYRRIPAGGNWSDITDMMTNYAAVERTHSNIYRRLVWSEPSITIGHYRKAMLIHPEQHRGLSLREASRLQSFPDWFRFAGSETDLEGGLTYKQQQLGNAVCPLVTRAVAGFLFKL